VRTRERPAEGVAVGLELDPAELHLFEESGKALR
jgi:hypothetical protein